MPTSDREVTTAARHLAKIAAAAFGGAPRVQRFYSDDESHSVDILICTGALGESFSTYSTLGVHEATNMLDENDVRVELAGVATSADTEYPNMLATAASYVQENDWLAAPGVVFPNLVRKYGLSENLEHVLWVPPFPWDDLHAVSVSQDLTVHWLLAVPISESERRFLLDEGYFALERLFEERGVEYYNLRRPPLV